LWAATALVGVALVAGIGAFSWYRASALQPPPLDLNGFDPAIVVSIGQARAAVQESPRSAPAWGRLGMVLAAHNFQAEANACFMQAERLDPRQPRWPYYQGVALSHGDPEAALRKFQRAVELCDASPDAPRLRLGELLIGQGRLEEAEIQFRRLLQSDSGHARAHLDLARLASQRGDYAGSRHHLAVSVADDRTRKASHILRAEIEQRSDNAKAAETERRQADGLPDDPFWPDPFVDEVARLRTGREAQLDRADERLRRGRIGEAVALLEQTVRDYPDSDRGWSLLGKALVARKDWPGAERALRRAARLAPDVAEVQFHWGVALFQQQDPRGAAACFRKATELRPDYDSAYYNLGQCLKLQGDRAGAAGAFRAALRCNPDLAEARTALEETTNHRDTEAQRK
jgi:superkiller protein 3